MTESVCAGDGDATNQQYNLTYDNMEQGYVDATNFQIQIDAVQQLYNTCNEIRPVGMPIVQHECDAILSEGESVHIPWTYFLTWHTGSLMDYNTKEHLRGIYNSDYFVTRDELIMLNN